MSVPVRIQSRDQDVWFDELPDVLSKAAETFSLPDTEYWAPITELAPETIFEGLEVHGESAVIEDSQLVAPGTVYVTLKYADEGQKDAMEFHDRYPARVFFTADRAAKTATIDSVEIDTTSFFAE